VAKDIPLLPADLDDSPPAKPTPIAKQTPTPPPADWTPTAPPAEPTSPSAEPTPPSAAAPPTWKGRMLIFLGGMLTGAALNRWWLVRQQRQSR